MLVKQDLRLDFSRKTHAIGMHVINYESHEDMNIEFKGARLRAGVKMMDCVKGKVVISYDGSKVGETYFQPLTNVGGK